MANNDKRLFVNFSSAKLDLLIAKDVIIQLRATKVFKDQNILDSSSLAGDDAEKSLLRKVDESDAVIHLLSSDFQNEICSKALDKCIEVNKKMFPVVIRSFVYMYDEKLQNILDDILPEDKEEISGFINEAQRDRVITMIIKKIFDKLEIRDFNDQRGRNRKSLYWMIIAIVLFALATVPVTYYYTDDWRFTLIPSAGFLVIIFFLLSVLKNPFSITLYKPVNS